MHTTPLHPNLRSKRNKNAWERIWCYINKEGHASGDDLPLPLTFRGFSRVATDLKEWKAAAKRIHPVNPFPFKLPDDEGTAVQAPKGHLRKYIYVIQGPPDCGKSYWRFRSLKDYFMVEDPKYPMEGYAGQQLIVYDDFPFGELKTPDQLLIKNGAFENREMLVGTTRYHKVYYPKMQQRIVVVILNELPEWFREDRIKSRVEGYLVFNSQSQFFEFTEL